MSGYQNHGALLGPLNNRCRIILRIKNRDHNFDNHPCISISIAMSIYIYVCMYPMVEGLGPAFQIHIGVLREHGLATAPNPIKSHTWDPVKGMMHFLLQY